MGMCCNKKGTKNAKDDGVFHQIENESHHDQGSKDRIKEAHNKQSKEVHDLREVSGGNMMK